MSNKDIIDYVYNITVYQISDKQLYFTRQVIFSHFFVLFSAAEDFEMLCPSRLDELLKEAYALENSLIEQKEKLKHRLQLLSKTLGPLRSQTT